jgi:hypothetical protein
MRRLELSDMDHGRALAVLMKERDTLRREADNAQKLPDRRVARDRAEQLQNVIETFRSAETV